MAALLGALFLFNAFPAQSQQRTVWSATLTPGSYLAGLAEGCSTSTGMVRCDDTSVLTSDVFTHDGTNYRIDTIAESAVSFSFTLTTNFPQSLRSATLNVGSTALSLASANYVAGSPTWAVGLLTPGQAIQMSLVLPPPSLATVRLSLPDVDNPDAPFVREGESITVAAHLSQAPTSNVEIPIRFTVPMTSDNRPAPTAAEDNDYVLPSPLSITINAGQTTGTVTITTKDDEDTDNEVLYVEIDPDLSPSIGSRVNPYEVGFTILDDDESTTTTPTDPPTTNTPTNQPTDQPPSNTGGTGSGSGGDGSGSPPEEPSDTPCGESDREYLVSFYEATGGENWLEKEYWNSEEPLGEWFGVKTDEDGEVISLRLADNNLSRDMPTEELLCLNENTELKELALWDNEDLSGDVPKGLELAVERAALRAIAEMLNLNPEWFEDYEDPFNFEDWHSGVTTDDEGRVTELDLPGEIPESIRSQFKKREITITTSSDGGCALSPEGSSAFSLFLLTLFVFAVLGRKRVR